MNPVCMNDEKVDLNGILTLTIDVAGNMNHFPHCKPQVGFILMGQYHKSLTYLKFYNPYTPPPLSVWNEVRFPWHVSPDYLFCSCLSPPPCSYPPKPAEWWACQCICPISMGTQPWVTTGCPPPLQPARGWEYMLSSPQDCLGGDSHNIIPTGDTLLGH